MSRICRYFRRLRDWKSRFCRRRQCGRRCRYCVSGDVMMVVRGDVVGVSDSGNVNENERESETLSESECRRPMRRPWELLMMMKMKERNCRRRHQDQGATRTLRWWPVQHRPQRAVGQPWPAAIGEGATLSRCNLTITARAMLKCTCRRRRRRGGATQMARRRVIVDLVPLFLCAGDACSVESGCWISGGLYSGPFASFGVVDLGLGRAWLVFPRGPGLVRRLSEAGSFGLAVFVVFFLSSAACFVSVLAAFAHLPANTPGSSTSLVFLVVRGRAICPPLPLPPGPSLPLCQLRVRSATALDQRTSS